MDVKVDFVVPGVYVFKDWFPGNCSGCPFARDNGYDFDCVIKESLGIGYQCDCSAKAIKTPHGDLIDRDKILDHAYFPYSYDEERYIGTKMVVDDFDISEAETLVEANK